MSLEFFPTTAGVYSKTDRCQNEIQQTEDPSKPYFLPFNDAQWTIAHAGYGIALPTSGTLQYYENTSVSNNRRHIDLVRHCRTRGIAA